MTRPGPATPDGASPDASAPASALLPTTAGVDGMHRPATVYFADRVVRLDALRARGARAAAALAAQGIGAGDVIALVLRNEPAYVEVLTCLRCLGATMVQIPWHLTAREMRPILAAVRPRLAIVHADLLARVQEAAAPLRSPPIAVLATPPAVAHACALPASGPVPDAANLLDWEALIAAAAAPLAMPTRSIPAIAVTSGSTGAPKIIRRTGEQRWLQWAEARTGNRPAIRCSIVTAPLYNAGQYGVFNQACHHGADQVIMPRFEAEAFLQAVERHRVNHAYLVPAMFVRLLKLPQPVRRRYDLSSLTYVLQTGAACPPAVKRQMIEWLGPVIWEAYGSSETSTIAACSSAEWLARPTRVGKPNRRVVILDDDGNIRPPHETGRIYVDVTDLPRISYENATLMQRHLEGRDYLSMGDVGALDDDGYLAVRGRIDDLINNGRLKVYPEEIEHAMLQHPQVLDCVAFAIPDEIYGQAIAALVQPADAMLDIERDLRPFLSERLSGHKIPVVIGRAEGPLRRESGKTCRAQLAREFAQAGSALATASGHRRSV